MVSVDWPKGKPVRVTRGGRSGGASSASAAGPTGSTRRRDSSVDGGAVLRPAPAARLARDAPQPLRRAGRGRLPGADRHAAPAAGRPARAGAADEQGQRACPAWPRLAWERCKATAAGRRRRLAQPLQRLDEAAALQPELPPALQAELRDYQPDGFAWLVRLAARAASAPCLADDMGLGKTVQTLALLLHRAARARRWWWRRPRCAATGWPRRRASRPALRVELYGEGEGAPRGAARRSRRRATWSIASLRAAADRRREPSPRVAGPRWCSTRRRRIKNAGHATRQGRRLAAAPTSGWRSPARRWRTAWASCGRS